MKKHKPLKDRRPWASGDDDKYVGRFMLRSLRFSLRQGHSVDSWFAMLPRNLQTNVYYVSAARLLGAA